MRKYWQQLQVPVRLMLDFVRCGTNISSLDIELDIMLEQ